MDHKDEIRQRLNMYDEGKRFALDCIAEDIELLVAFMELTELEKIEEGCYNTLAVVSEVLKQRVIQLDQHMPVEQVGNVLKVDFKSISNKKERKE
jgi:hypothetical protein|tara:strand:- start:63 stop:347 length:285 start_codon:yes stop_codon:yes gene_type:complete